MKRIFGLSVLLMCSGLMLAPSTPAVEVKRVAVNKKVARNEPQQTAEQLINEQLKKDQQEHVVLAERIRALEDKPNQADRTRRFDPYSYP